ncbi:septum site-determining protein MinC [Crinalium epipsammum PCC 9333]|uniref:Probable septum site-determining protein MinC n=1 Tax=Crinalium epipsammum PCC 9333 TaxID=1173022 RepID=K9VY20_9CYAN|nr:septum site-determining protein MinC [Crinalium epipsammum]AFZ13018.1 septum site-determining protein MinC [Crinalium epipsammum PCC 9333]
MNSDSALPLPQPKVGENPPTENSPLQVQLKTEQGKLLLILPTEAETSAQINWQIFCEQLKNRLQGNDRFWQSQMPVHLVAQDRLLDGRHFKAIADTLGNAQLQLQRVYTSRRQTAVAAATAGYAVEQQVVFSSLKTAEVKPDTRLKDPLYVETTVRSGAEIHHPGTVVILGDVNPGGIVVAGGDILVWGRLRGVAHAGSEGNSECRIMALQMQPTQLRIADYVARAPEKPPSQFYPEVAYVTTEGIRITKATDFSKTHLLSNS